MTEPKYRTIAHDLQKLIESGDLRPGGRIPTEAELEARYGVSRITVTRAILELQNLDLVYRVKGSGTYVSKKSAEDLTIAGKRAGGMSIVSVIFPQGEQNGAHEMLVGIESECARDGYYVTVHNSRNKPVLERSLIENLLASGSGGLILFPCPAAGQNADICSQLIIRRFPIVFVDRRIEYLNVPLAACQNEQAMHELVTRIIRSGHERIGFLCNSIETVTSEHERYKGYCQAHIEAGLLVRSELVFRQFESLEKPNGAFSVDHMSRRHYADAALDYFLGSREKPTCVVAVNDILAIALLKAALERRIKVPGELAITGFDDLYVAEHIEVPLTTVRQPFGQIGGAAARMLLDRIKGEDDVPLETRLPGEIIVRASAEI